MPGRPVFSVLMSVKDAETYLEEAIQSIINQTYKDWEMIIVDNGSRDRTRMICADFAGRDARIRILNLFSPHSQSFGLNHGLSACRGEWILRMDGDDRALPNRLERQVAFIADHPQLTVASTLSFYIDSRGRRVAKTSHNLTSESAFEQYRSANEMIGILHPGAAIRKTAILEVGGYRPEFDPANDIDLWARLTEWGGTILVQPEYLMEYRVHTGSAIGSGFLLGRTKHEWARECMRARRSGQNEPTWPEFLAAVEAKPLLARLNRRRKLMAKYYYRTAAMRYLDGSMVRAAIDFLTSALLQPRYSIPRLRSQWLSQTEK